MDFVALEMIRKLQQIDKENEYVIFVNEGPDTACLQETQNFKIVVFGGPYPIWEQMKLPKMAREAQVDLLHCTSNTAPVNCPVPLVVTIHDIIYFESDNNTTDFVLCNSRRISAYKTLKTFEDTLSLDYVRIHHKYIVVIVHLMHLHR